jgi:hypothetical protein
MIPLAITITGILLAAIGFELGGSWPYKSGTLLGCVATILSIIGAWLQYQESKPYEHHFSENSWEPIEDGYAIHISVRRHRKGRATTTTVFQKTGTGYEEVICGIKSTSAGGVVVEATKPFTGKLVVR